MKFKSKFEQSTAAALRKAKVKFKYESMVIPYIMPRNYTPDFILSNGIIIETKGFFKPDDRRKHLLIREQHPKLDIRFVFYDASRKLRKNSKTTYGQWCDKHGIIWSDKTIPKSWLKR